MRLITILLKLFFTGLIAISFINCSENISFENPESKGNQESNKPDSPEDENDPDGPFPVENIEVFYQQGTKAKVDILFVVDNSVSMRDEQRELASSLRPVVSNMFNVDWQIGVTSTDLYSKKYGLDGRLVPFDKSGTTVLTSESKNYLNKFSNTVVRKETIACGLGYCPTSLPQPLKAIKRVVERKDTTSSKFFRDGAEFVSVIISDSDEGEIVDEYLNSTTPKAVIRTINSALGGDKLYTNYSLIIKDEDWRCYIKQGNGEYGTYAQWLSKLTGGGVASLCDTGYANVLNNIGQKSRKLTKSITLEHEPAFNKLKLFMVPPHITDWQVNGKVITFDNPPAEGTKITVQYDFFVP